MIRKFASDSGKKGGQWFAITAAARRRAAIAIVLGAAVLTIAFLPDDHQALASTTTTANWAGYEAIASGGNAFTYISGGWTVPAVTSGSASGGSYSSIWVGIDGFNNNTLEQTGTEGDYINGSPHYHAWWEMIPAPETVITSMPISPGDRMFASVRYIGGGNFVLSLDDLTTNTTFSTTQSNPSAPRSTVEWIAEDTQVNGVIGAMANYGTAVFNSATASVNGASPVPISSLPGYSGVELIPTSSADLGAYPFPLTNNGQGFTVTVTPPQASTLTWSPNGSATGNDTSGNWDTTTTNWSGATGSSAWTNGDVAAFGAGTTSSATITLQAAVSAAGIAFNPGGPPSGENYYTIASAAPADTLTVTGGAILANSNDEISAPIDFTNGLVLSGIGTLTLTGSNTNTAGTIINPGASMLVNSGAAFGTAAVQDLGSLGVAGSTGNLSFPGNLSEGQSGSMIVRVGGNQSGQFDHYTVNGTAAIDGNLTVTLQNGYVPTAGTSLNVLTASTVTGNFSSITLTQHPIDLFAATTATSSDINLLFTLQMPSLVPYALTANQAAVAQYLDATDGYNGQSQPSSSYLQLINAIGSQYSQQIPITLDLLSPIDLQAFPQVAIQNAINLDQTISSHLLNLDAGATGFDSSGFTMLNPGQQGGSALTLDQMLQNQSRMVTLDAGLPSYLGYSPTNPYNPSAGSGQNWSAFITGAAQFDSYSDTSSIGSSNVTTENATLGADYAFFKFLSVGAFFNYDHSDINLDSFGSTGTVNGYTPGVYADMHGAHWFLDGMAAYTYMDNSESRNIGINSFSATAHGNFSGNSYNGSADLGYRLYSTSPNPYSPLSGWTLIPMVSLGYTHADFNSFSETGAEAAGLNVSSMSADSFRSMLSATFLYTIHLSPQASLVPGILLGWRHEYLNNSQGITAQLQGAGTGSFTVNTASPSSDVAVIAPSLNINFNKSVSGFVDYELDLGSNKFHAQQVFAGLAISF
ncbi:MAG: G1 family glutamic endopeptidase [Phycisphaerae bacterium]